MAVDAVIVAGYSLNKPDLLAQAEGVTNKALIDLAGEPMIGWVARALRGSAEVGRLTVVGLSETDGVDFGGPIDYLPNQSGQLENVISGLLHVLDVNPTADQALLVTTDVPLITPASIDWLLAYGRRERADFYYPVIRDTVMEAQFPGSRRSYVSTRDGRFCGGDIFLLRPALMAANFDKVRQLLANRKNYLALARIIGFRILLKTLFRRLTLEDAESAGRRIVDAHCLAIPSPYADLGMDVDKPFQLEIARAALKKRVESKTDGFSTLYR